VKGYGSKEPVGRRPRGGHVEVLFIALQKGLARGDEERGNLVGGVETVGVWPCGRGEKKVGGGREPDWGQGEGSGKDNRNPRQEGHLADTG